MISQWEDGSTHIYPDYSNFFSWLNRSMESIKIKLKTSDLIKYDIDFGDPEIRNDFMSILKGNNLLLDYNSITDELYISYRFTCKQIVPDREIKSLIKSFRENNPDELYKTMERLAKLYEESLTKRDLFDKQLEEKYENSRK